MSPGRVARGLGAQLARAVLAAFSVVIIGSFATAGAAVYLYPNVIYPIWRTTARLSVGEERGFGRVDFPSASGLRLAGWYGEGSGARDAGTIIVCHGWAADKRDMLGLAQALRASGFNVLLLDLHGWGDSDRGPVTFGDQETGDILGAVRFLKERAAGRRHRIGLIGFSMGAAAAIRAAAQNAEIDALVADASYARLDVQAGRFFRRFAGPFWPVVYVPARWFGERLTGTAIGTIVPLRDIARITPRPVLIIHGTRDRVINMEDARQLYQAAGAPKTLWLIEGAGHGETRRVAPAALWDARVAGFFRESLGRGAADPDQHGRGRRYGSGARFSPAPP